MAWREDHLLRELEAGSAVRTLVNLLVHTIADVNTRLRRGQPFFVNIVRDGIALLDTPGYPFDPAKPLSADAARAEAQGYFDEWFGSAAGFARNAGYARRDNDLKLAAFLLHQATERLYDCMLLVLTLYSPKEPQAELPAQPGRTACPPPHRSVAARYPLRPAHYRPSPGIVRRVESSPLVEQPDAQTRQALLARDFAALSRDERARKLVLDPTRQGQRELTDAIRAALVTNGTLGEDAMVASVLESRDLTRAHARLATSYRLGDIVVVRKSEKGRPRSGVGHRVEAIDAATCTVRLLPDKRRRQRTDPKPVDWQPARWGADVAEVFTEAQQE